MTPAQLRAYSAVVRLGSVRAAAAELGLSDAGVSMHVAALRKELDDPLFTRTGAGLAFTPGGLRLASRRSKSWACNNKPRSRSPRPPTGVGCCASPPPAPSPNTPRRA